MADAPIQYRKLPGSGSGALARHRLWEGPDHLLAVTSWPTGEGYKRFFFRDIQAIVVRKTARRTIINVVFVLLGLLIAGSMYASADDPSGEVAAYIVAGLFMVCVIINSLLGETCETLIQTAVQTEKIASLCRLRTVLKVLAGVQPRIVEAQSDAPPAA